MTENVTDRLKAIRKREQEALAGPWGHWPEAGEIEVMQTEEAGSSRPKDDGTIVVSSVRPEEGWGATARQNGTRIYRDNYEPTAEFIAHARTDVPWLLDQVERYRSALRVVGNEYIVSVDQTLGEIYKTAYPEQTMRIAQIRGTALEAISDVVLDLEEDDLFE